MSTPRERPVLFSAPMVRAILEGRKTQTRRVVKPQPPFWMQAHLNSGFRQIRNLYDNVWGAGCAEGSAFACRSEDTIRCPYGTVGDRLWVRETWARTTDYDGQFLLDGVKALYRATPVVEPSRWRPSIHMPRWASRITLEVEAVRVERVQYISEADAMAEGVERIEFGPHEIAGLPVHPMTSSYAEAFGKLWDSINGKSHPWDANPWVWAITFRRMP